MTRIWSWCSLPKCPAASPHRRPCRSRHRRAARDGVVELHARPRRAGERHDLGRPLGHEPEQQPQAVGQLARAVAAAGHCPDQPEVSSPWRRVDRRRHTSAPVGEQVADDRPITTRHVLDRPTRRPPGAAAGHAPRCPSRSRRSTASTSGRAARERVEVPASRGGDRERLLGEDVGARLEGGARLLGAQGRPVR